MDNPEILPTLETETTGQKTSIWCLL